MTGEPKNLNFQAFCGETYFQHRLPLDCVDNAQAGRIGQNRLQLLLRSRRVRILGDFEEPISGDIRERVLQ